MTSAVDLKIRREMENVVASKCFQENCDVKREVMKNIFRQLTVTSPRLESKERECWKFLGWRSCP
jgi:hypothetical protein